MSSRRGIFFSSKSRTNEKINQLPTTIISNEDPSSSNNNQTTTTNSNIVKKKIILNHTKRTLTKTTIYSGPRKIFSTNYKANRTQLNHKVFFGGNADEYDDIDKNEQTMTKTNDRFRPTTIIQNKKTKIDQKQIHIVASNTRQPTTCEELDETQSYIDDMEYLLTGFQSGKSFGDRCLSAIKFAELCTKSSFRMHLKTESAFKRVLDCLQDAPDVPSLNLCTVFILYVLSSDTLPSGMNPSTIRFMLDLTTKNSTTSINDQEYNKIKERILILNNKFLSMDIFYDQRFNTCDIILETFVNISHNNVKEWFRNETRLMGGFELIIDAVNSIVQDLSNNDFECYSLSDLSIRYRKVCRYISMLEEFSSDNSEQLLATNIDVNRMYIAQCNQYSLFHSLSKLLDLSLVWWQQYSENNTTTTNPKNDETNTAKSSNKCDIFRDGCKTIMSVLVILTNDCESNCDRLTSDDRFFFELISSSCYY